MPNAEDLELRTLILDLNGTLTVHGEMANGVSERLERIKDKGLTVILFSGDTRGTGQKIADALDIELVRTATAEEKRDAALTRNPATCVTIGNGNIDRLLFKVCRLSIATLQAEGVHGAALTEADIVVPSFVDALALLLDENSLIATVRP